MPAVRQRRRPPPRIALQVPAAGHATGRAARRSADRAAAPAAGHAAGRAARLAVLLALAAFAALAAGCGGHRKPSVDDLTWLSGCWSGKADGLLVDEQWGKPAGGSLLGTSRQVKDDKTVFHEYRRIEQTEGGLVLVTHPFGAEGARFHLQDRGRSDVTFAGEEGGTPRRIIYHRKGTTLYVRAESLEAGRKVERKFKLKRAACE